MSARPTEPLALEDVSVLSRRGQTTHTDERRLQHALTQDAVLSLTHQIGLDMDREGDVRAGDEDLILRAADAALARVHVPVTRSSSHVGWRVVPLAAAACLMLSAGAGAAWWVARGGLRDVESTTAPAAANKAKRSRARKPPEVAATTAPATPVAPAPVASAEVSEAVVPTPIARDKHVSAGDAATLFHAASVARGAGEVARARKLYAQLIAQHADSEEAHVAHVALGKLWLSAGRAAAAEREFRQYLDAGGGPLGEEALYSRAQALQRLGRDVEERAAWTKLLRDYPHSVYASHATTRLDNLGRAGSDL